MRTIFSIVLILIGVIGLYFVFQNSSNNTPEPVVRVESQKDEPPRVREVTITVAIAKTDLAEKTILTSENFELTSMKVPDSSSDKTVYNIDSSKLGSIVGYALNTPVATGSQIPVSALVAPGSAEFVSLFRDPNKVIVPFQLYKIDQYLLKNVKVGDYVDVYLLYENDTSSEAGRSEIQSPGNSSSITMARLKPMMMHRQVLTITQPTSQNTAATDTTTKATRFSSDPNALGNEGQLSIELTNQEVKIVRVLNSKAAKFVIFPSSAENAGQQIDLSSSGLTVNEIQYPVSNEDLFVAKPNVREFRGGN